MGKQKKEVIKWRLPKRKQPVWKVIKFILRPFFYVKNVEFLGEEFPSRCIIVSNHNNKKVLSYMSSVYQCFTLLGARILCLVR